ncbi:MAG: cytochrome P450, partial [Acidimicrobiales bacterium]
MDLASVNYFTDSALMADAYPYYEAVRARGPVWREPHHGAFMITGYDEISAICRDSETFSSCNGFAGPFFEFPEDPVNL